MTFFLNYRWSGILLGNLINVCLFGDNIDKATEIIIKLSKSQNEIIGVPDNQTIELFINYCIEKNNFNELLVCTLLFYVIKKKKK